jgi:hypothetical protein
MESEYNEQFKRKTGNRLIKMNENPWFSGTKNAMVWWIYLADRQAAAQLEVQLCDD